MELRQLMSMFLILAVMAVGSALAVVLAPSPIYGALLLVGNLLAVAVMFLGLGAEFLFAAQIIVYAGAIVVLFLFVIMLLGVDRETKPAWSTPLHQIAFAVIPVAALGGALVLAVRSTSLVAQGEVSVTSTQQLGLDLFQRWVLPFEITSLLLVVAAVGVVVMGAKK